MIAGSSILGGVAAFIVIVMMLGGVFAGFFFVFRSEFDHDNPRRWEARQLNKHTKLMVKAAKASRKGRHGEANVYQEAADRVLSSKKTIIGSQRRDQ